MDHAIRTPGQLHAVLASFRDVRGYSQRDMARKLGITQQAVSAYEREPATMSVERLMKVLAELNVELVLRERDLPGTSPAKSEW